MCVCGGGFLPTFSKNEKKKENNIKMVIITDS